MGQGWRVGVSVVLLVLTSACGQGSSNRWKEFPVPLYADSTLMSRPNGWSDLQSAMSFWEEKAGKQLFDFKGVWQGAGLPYEGDQASPTKAKANVIFFQNPWNMPMEIAGRTTVFPGEDGIVNSIVMINPEIPLCGGDCVGQPYTTSQRKDFTHELGHFLGLGHSDDTSDIMYPVLQPGGNLSQVKFSGTELVRVTQ